VSALLSVRHVSKSFPGIRALDDVSLDIEAGRVHAVTGENGAGKSTLMRILAGLEAPDAGEIVFNGRRPGISMMHQELLPFPDLTVAENVVIGREPTRRFPGWVDRAAMRAEARRLLGRLGVEIDPGRRMGELSVAAMQAVEIARALHCGAGVLIMDEPTSALSAREAEALFEVIGELTGRGVAVVFISHKLEEIFRLAATVTVLRDGRHVATLPAADLDRERLIGLMAGRALAEAPARSERPAGESVLETRGVTLRRGEILGLAGLMGSGRTELACAIARRGRTAMVTEDRRASGLVPTMTVRENMTLASLARWCRGPLIDRRAEEAAVEGEIRRFSIRTAGVDANVMSLSGGNQQKVVLAKALLTRPEILILDEPTRGIDVAAKAEIHALIARLAAEGMAILLVSSEIAELLALCHRILVMREGAIAAECDGRHATEEQILRHAMPN
jgi:inositol transport system ATP-binding protein